MRRSLTLLPLVLTSSLHAAEPQPPAPSAPNAAGQAVRDSLDTKRRMLPLEVTIDRFAGWEPVRRLPGSSQYVDEETLEQAGTTDITRILRSVPGVNVQEEDGFGLRPNIGMRGGRIDRSADITLMEDGVLIAPAPYASPEAYYFPRIERMTGVEVRKGSSSIKYGPRTTNGALNLLTRGVPDVTAGEANVSVGSYGGFRSGLHAGSSVHKDYGSFGILGEFHHESSDGFKDIDTVGGDSGFNISDTMTKLRFKTHPSAALYQEVEMKLGYTDEDSNETYLGLTTADFNANPYRRYAASQVDTMDAYHRQAQISHYIEPMRDVGITTTIYRNDFNRNWYKLNNVRAGGVNRALTDVFNNPVTNAAHLNILRGATSAANGLTVRANKRDYYAQGVQTAVNYRANWFGMYNDIEMGLRYHYDEQDRFQHDDLYQMVGGVMVLTSRGAAGSESNRVSSGDAWAGYILDRIDFGSFALTPGARYEYIDLETRNYGAADPGRTGASLQRFGSTLTAFVPGIGAEYDINEDWQLLAGVHKGFAPPEPPTSTSAAQNAREEESVNYETGVRFRKNALHAEAIGFFNDYENLLGADTASSGGGATGDQFNGGEVRVWGLEAATGYDAAQLIGESPYRLPVRLSYTYTQAEFRNSFNSSFAEWGNVRTGDELPYIPKHQVALSAGVEARQWKVNAIARHTGRMRTVAGSGPLTEERSTDASFVVDLTAEYAVTEHIRPFVSVTNVLDQEYTAARRPAGARPGAPQMVYGGLKIMF